MLFRGNRTMSLTEHKKQIGHSCLTFDRVPDSSLKKQEGTSNR